MRAVLIKDGAGPVESLYLGEVETPVAQADEILVKIKTFGLNRMDIVQRDGNYKTPPGISPILGVEFAGHIAAVGTNVSRWKIGDEVLGLAAGGAYAEYIVVPQTQVLRKPARLTWTEAASIPEVCLTAFQAIVLHGEVKANDDVLVHAGASGVGIMSIQLARFNGARTVTATASTQEKLHWLLSIPSGATDIANYKTEDFSQVVKPVTHNKGVEVIVDFVGQSHLEQNLASLAVDGRMIMVALLSGSIASSINLSPILHKRLRIQGSTLRTRTPAYQAELIARFESEVLPHITGEEGLDGPIKTYIHKVYPWTDIQEAHREMESNTTSGKIVVEVY